MGSCRRCFCNNWKRACFLEMGERERARGHEVEEENEEEEDEEEDNEEEEEQRGDDGEE